MYGLLAGLDWVEDARSPDASGICWLENGWENGRAEEVLVILPMIFAAN